MKLRIGHKKLRSSKLVDVVLKKYTDDGSPALLLMEDGAPYAKVSVRMPEVDLAWNEILVKDYAENEGLLQELVRAGILYDTGLEVPTGFVKLKVCAIMAPELLKQLDPEGEDSMNKEKRRLARKAKAKHLKMHPIKVKEAEGKKLFISTKDAPWMKGVQMTCTRP